MLRFSILIMIVLGGAIRALAATETQVGKIYEVGKQDKPPEFIQTLRVEDGINGERIHHSKIVDADGDTVMLEDAVTSGAELRHQHIKNFQLKQAYTVEFEPAVPNQASRKVTFTLFSLSDDGSEKKLETKSEQISQPLVTSSVSETFLQSKWNEVLSGKTVEALYGVPSKLRTIGFAFAKLRDESINGKDCVVINMTPQSFLVSLIVSPIELSFSKSDQHMVRYYGMTVLKRKTKNGFSDISKTEIRYEDANETKTNAK